MQLWIQASLPHRVARKIELTDKPLVAALSLFVFSYDLQLEVNAVLLIIPHFYTSVSVLIYGASSGCNTNRAASVWKNKARQNVTMEAL